MSIETSSRGTEQLGEDINNIDQLKDEITAQNQSKEEAQELKQEVSNATPDFLSYKKNKDNLKIKNERIYESIKDLGFYSTEGDSIVYNTTNVVNYLRSISNKSWQELKLGNRYGWIMAIQIYLQSQGINVGEIDGILGNKTKNGVIEFQRKNGIKVDGLPGTETIQTILSIGYPKNDNQPISKEAIDTTESEENQQDIPQGEINQESSNDGLDSEKLRSYFCESANNLLIEKIDNTNFFEISYIDKTSGSKIKGIIPSKWNGNSNIYMPGDRSGIEETMKNKNFKEEIINKNSQKARFIFEGDSDKIKNGTMQSARYNNLINNFGNMIAPMEAVGAHPQINIIGHSRAGATVNSLIGRYNSISRFIILDGTYGVYKNVLQSNIPGKIFYTNGGGTKKYVNNYKNKPNLEVIGDYENLGHEQIVAKALFDDSHTHQDLFG